MLKICKKISPSKFFQNICKTALSILLVSLKKLTENYSKKLVQLATSVNSYKYVYGVSYKYL
jgi:hypothetical protein